MKELLELWPADLPELLSLGRITGATLHMDELFWNNLSNAADTNRLSSNTREPYPSLFLLHRIPADSPATFLEESLWPRVAQGAVKSWENMSG